MADKPSSFRNRNSVELELYFLIERFLSAGPCKSAAKVLRRELDEHGLLPKRIDWEGGEHERSFESLLELNRHIGGNHLMKICQRLGPLLDKQIQPRIMGVASLLGAGSQSLLRTEADMQREQWPPKAHAALLHGKSPVPPINLVQPNWLHVSRGREWSSQAGLKHILPSSMCTKMQRHSRRLGHLSAVYCVLFDRTGRYIITGADDQLVKIWIAADGRLKATLRGHSAEITDMAINFENTLLASGSCDKTIRVWCLKTTAPVAVLQGHTGMVTSLQFSPFVRKKEIRYLASTGGDACVCFWEWNASNHKFSLKPIKYIERSRAGAMILCSSFSPGGMFFAAGSTDHVIRMYHFHAGVPEKIGELEKHTDRVDSICYSHHDNRFLSGSRDGTARIWRFERNEWRNIALEMKQKPRPKKDKNPPVDDIYASFMDLDTDWTTDGREESGQQKMKVTMVGWNIDDTLVITAVNDLSLKVWCSFTGTLKHVLKGHEDEVFVLEPNPIDPHVMLSAGHDGNIIIWDILKGTKIKGFFNSIEGQGHGAVFDCKFSPSGTSFAATDSHGHLMIYGFGAYTSSKMIPDELFFHTDYRPLIRDSNNYVLDEQTQQAPHLMAPPFLVDIDGNPYPPALQRLVPGRENCREDLLVPELAVNEDGAREVIGEQGVSAGAVSQELADQNPPPAAAVEAGEVQVSMRPSIDQMIEELQRQQDERLAASGEAPINSPPPAAPAQPLGSPHAVTRSNSVAGPGSSHMVGMRRVGETEGVRQSLGNMPQVTPTKDLAALSRNIIVKPLKPSILSQSISERLELAEIELRQFNIERKKKILVARRAGGDDPGNAGIQTRKKKGGVSKSAPGAAGVDQNNEETATNRLTTRALYDTDEEVEGELDIDVWNEEEYLENGDSSEYSDWCVDTSSNLQPPKRTSTRSRKRKRYHSSEDDEDDDEDEDTARLVDDDDYNSRESNTSRGKSLRKRDKQPAVKRKKVAKKRRKAPAPLQECSPESLQELLTVWRAPDWLTDVIPRKQPYFPQMGDELVYFRQGHELYVKAVEKRKTYPIDPNRNQAWNKYPTLREQELVRIVGVRYELLKNGVRLCCLKLNHMDPVTLKNSGGSFSIKYHDMPDVVDFLVLKQNYDIAMHRNWKPGDRFMSVIDDSWWYGVIESHVPFQSEYPDSMFQCFKVRWDNAEREHLSPWDMEPVSETRNPSVIGGGIQVTEVELKALLYKPKASEWQDQDQATECDRILIGLEKVMEHSLAEPFLTPVDLNAFPSYALSIEYPMDLNTIKRRVEHRFYRRVTALQFDIRYIEANAKKFNEPRSQIVRSAQVLCDALLSFISDRECSDPCLLLNKLSRGRKISMEQAGGDSGDETEDYDSTAGKSSSQAITNASRRRSRVGGLDPEGWRSEIRQLMATIMQCEDSLPFREPVDRNLYPHYYEVIQRPIDLSTVGDRLEQGAYTNPTEFARDMKLMFSNSRFYNTNKRSKIYSMTLRLSAMYEERMKEILTTWRKALRHQGKSMPSSSRTGQLSSSGQATSSRISSRPFSSLSGMASLTNGRTSQPNSSEDTDVDIVGAPGNSSQKNKQRPRRERRSVKPTRYADSDLEASGFPEPKPDYSDDDFELPSKKASPKKKAGPVKRQSSVSNGSSSNNTRYSTRAATGSIKARKYTNAGFFTDEDEEELGVVPQDNHSDSDTEVDETLATSRYHKAVHRANKAKRKKHYSSRTARGSKRKHSAIDTEEEEAISTEDESETDSSESSSSSSSSATSTDNSDSGSETGPDSPVGSHSQGSHLVKHKNAQASGKQGAKSSRKSSYASGATSSGRSVRTRNQGQQRVVYNEDSDNSDSGDSKTMVSSRGRVRKPTARARGIWD